MRHTSIILAAPKKLICDTALRVLRQANDVSIIARTSNLMETFNAVEELEPDAVLISHDMTICPEFEVMHGLFKAMNIRWIVLETNTSRHLRSDMGSLARSGLFPINLTHDASDIILQLRSVLRIYGAERPLRVIGRTLLIGASTGGVDALVQILAAFPKHCPPTFIVQHTGKGFGSSLVKLLDRQCSPNVVHAQDGMHIGPGTVCVGAGLRGHMILAAAQCNTVHIHRSANLSGHVPGIDALFHSATPHAGSMVAIVLTGMGRDGAEGLLALRKAGARTIVQDAETSVVYGMPKVAHDIGAAEFQLPLGHIASKALRLCKTPARI